MGNGGTSNRSLWPRQAPSWLAGVFYPLLVLAIAGLVGAVGMLVKDVAVLDIRVTALEKRGCD